MTENERFTWKTVHGWQTSAFLKVMNGLDKKNQQLKEENEELKQAYQTLKHRHSLLHDECLEVELDRDILKKDVISLEKENEQLKSIKQFAEKKGINIFHIETAFRNCWNGNAKLVTENNRLKEENNQLKREKERYKRLSEIRAENINNRILSIKEFINNCEDEKVKDTLEDLFYSEVKEYDLAKENRELKKEVERLTCINKQLEERLDKDIALNMDCGDVDG